MPTQQALARLFDHLGHVVRLAADGRQAIEQIHAQPIDLVISGPGPGGTGGLELVRRIHEHDPDLPCLVVAPAASREGAIAALRAGAFGTIELPLDAERLELVRPLALQAIECGRLRAENRRLHQALDARRKFEAIVGKSPRLARALALVERVADTASPILLCGESGTGKRLFARSIHHNSRRSARPFVAVDCASIPEPILEVELFGDSPEDPGAKAAFSPSPSARQGRLAAADGGTLYLSEIDALPVALQSRLLRFLESRGLASKNAPLGAATKDRVLDVRLIAGSRSRLEEHVASGRLRADLFAQIGTVAVDVPALRDRIDDLPLLVHHFLDRTRTTHGARARGITDEALSRLMDHDWPGNVRELEALIERLAVLVGDGEIEVHDLPEVVRAMPSLRTWAPRLPSTGLDFNDVVTRFENDLLEQALEQTRWNKNRAAKLLRLNRTTLLEKIKKRGLTPRMPLI